MITRADLKQSAVVFDEATHTYRRGDAELSGITGLIHSVLQLGVYPDASDYVKKVQIPKAGYYGTCVHKSIQTYEELGLEMTQFPEKEHPTAGTLPAQDVFQDLATYKLFKPRKCRTVACEFTVDFGNFASQIDQIWADEDDGIYLVDFKTNNLDYYPGGAEGLKEYLSWQLSCYAVMFEQQTGYKVKGLVGLWLRKGEGDLWRIPRVDGSQVLALLQYTEIHKNDWGGFTYYNPEMQVYAKIKPTMRVLSSNEMHASEWLIPQADAEQLLAVTNLIADIKRQADEAEARCAALKEKLKAAMEAAGVKSWDTGVFKATVKAGDTRKTFDSKKFQADHPDLYEQYIKETETKSSILITLPKK